MQRKSNTDLLYEAAEFADFTAAAGWPDELTPPQLVALWVGHEFMRPLGEADALMRWGGTEAEKKRTACKIVMRMLRDSALPTEERTETTQRPPVKRLKSLSPPVFVEEEQPAEVRKWVVVTRSAVQQCIAKLGIEPPEHINAWLAPANAHRVGVPANGTPSPAKPKKKTKQEMVVEWLDECERRAAEKGKEFDRRKMPGRKEDFFELLQKLDLEFKSMKSVESLKRYLDGNCKWIVPLRPSLEARALYAELFPEAFKHRPGAVSSIRDGLKKNVTN